MVYFWGENLNLTVNWFIRKKKQKNDNGAYGEIWKKNSNCHNFGCTQDRVVIFGSMVGVGPYGFLVVGQFNGVI